MAMTVQHFTNIKKTPLGPGGYMVTGTYSPGADGAVGGTHSYASGGENMTHVLWKAITGCNEILTLQFSRPVHSTVTRAANIDFDHVRTASSHGKVHFRDQVAAHTHSFLIKGGQAAAGTDVITVKAPVSAQVIGKEEATDKTALGGATNGGVQSSTQTTEPGEAGATSDYGGFSCRFTAWAR